MINWLEFFYYFISGAAMLLTLTGLWFSRIMPGLDRWSKRFFAAYFIVLLLCAVTGLGDTVLYRFPDLELLKQVFLFLEVTALTLPLPMLAVYLLRCCGENIRRSILLRTVIGLWAVFVALLAVSTVPGFAFYLLPEGEYLRSAGFMLLMLPIDLLAFLNLAAVIRRRRKLSRRIFLSFVIVFLFMGIALTAHTFFDVYPLISISMVLSAISMLGLIISDQVEQSLRQQRETAEQQRELARQKASVMVLQMRPHFIFNTMMSIYSLCNQDSQKARQVTMDFTNDLRKKFNAVASDSAIPFSAELEHTRAYLAVEQAQFEDLLLVDYDTPHIRFRLPPLTLQPIAENAVKHGMNPDAGPLRVSIRTRQTETGSEITVEDNGPGFDFSDGEKPHPTLENIRQRLEMMCGGKMEIMPKDGGGTTVKMTIPQADLPDK